MNVYVLVAGVDGIGESVRGAFSSLLKARAAAKDIPHSTNKTTWKEVAENYWHAGDEYVLIEVWCLDENIFEGMGRIEEKKHKTVNTVPFQDSFDFSDTFEHNIAVDTISDTDLYAIWHAQNMETEL